METKARWRAAVAGVIVSVGFVAISPSFDFDSDNDGVVDSIEVYEQGSDPSSADTFGKSIVAAKARK
ncbi:MAG: hypothetical protein M3277_08730 [Actinomycetota bacterium]|nr:hypothetical protein [Actinomycetota bacterium]